MLYHRGPRFTGFVSDWEASAVRAMQAEPLYFARWYTIKSIGLALSLGVIGYLIWRK